MRMRNICLMLCFDTSGEPNVRCSTLSVGHYGLGVLVILQQNIKCRSIDVYMYNPNNYLIQGEGTLLVANCFLLCVATWLYLYFLCYWLKFKDSIESRQRDPNPVRRVKYNSKLYYFTLNSPSLISNEFFVLIDFSEFGVIS